MISACMMAHVNSSGTHIPLWMNSPDALGWGISPGFPTREGTYFGQIMVTNANYALDAYFCNGPGADQNVVPGRLGADQGPVPYANAWPTTAGFDGQCETSHIDKNKVDHGKCTAHTTGGVIDGDTSCKLNDTVYNHPLTVWRGATYQAESAEGGGFTNGVWSKGAYGFIANDCPTPGQNGCAIIKDDKNGMGKRIGFIGPSKGVRFTNVQAPASTSNLIVYYTNGDAYNLTRYLQFIVNGTAAQVRPFGGLQDWSHPRGAAVTLSGFKAGGNNEIFVTADSSHAAPDLDWIEVLGTTSSVPSAGLCTPSMWDVTASVNGDQADGAVDGNLTTRWSTGRNMANGDYLQIDFQGIVSLSAITLNNSGTSGKDYPGTVSVFTSQDGKTFNSTMVDSSPGSATQTVLNFPQETMRAIRIKVTSPSSSNWWSIGEIKTDCQL